MKTRLTTIASKQYFVIGVAVILYVVGAPNIIDGLSFLQFLDNNNDNSHVPSDVIWMSVLTSAGVGFVLVGIPFKLQFIHTYIVFMSVGFVNTQIKS